MFFIQIFVYFKNLVIIRGGSSDEITQTVQRVLKIYTNNNIYIIGL